MSKTSFLLPSYLSLQTLSGMYIFERITTSYGNTFEYSLSLTFDYKNAIGETATVYIPCPPKDHGLGKVNVMINGQLREVTAINNGDELIKTGTQVRIIDLQGDTVVIEK